MIYLNDNKLQSLYTDNLNPTDINSDILSNFNSRTELILDNTILDNQ